MPDDTPLTFILAGEPGLTSSIWIIRMVPKEEFGGALVSVGPAVEIAPSSIEVHGVQAFSELQKISPSSPDNTDLRPRDGVLRKKRTVLVGLDDQAVEIGPLHRTGPGATPSEKRSRPLPVAGKELLELIDSVLSRSR